MAKLIVELPESTHRDLKKKAALQHRTIKDVVTDLLERYLSETAKPTSLRETGICGRWRDTRTAEEIIADIKRHRSWFTERRSG